ncbi:Sodium/calcium exchanger protein-domain-containing protein [Leptodontidium sp. MPI-SDFR-AT-0119]|nr:Sodium/calcium exchanger protein-domain-containing protein [Leptodontidium sp. MPI-SDFR-AT-0119]
MKKTSPDSNSSADRIRSWARTKAHGTSPLSKSSRPTLPISNPSTTTTHTTQQTRTSSSLRNDTTNIPPFPSTDINGLARQSSKPTSNNVVENTSSDNPPPAPPPQVDGEGAVINNEKPAKKNVAMRFWLTTRSILLSSYINLLLVFVPIGIAAKAAKLSPGIIFAMNAVAIVPLAGLLSHATESVAKRMGDTIGALMNVTFGNAVELIIFMYVYLARDQDEKEREALLKALSNQSSPISFGLSFVSHAFNEIRIVQASLLGSILANLLLILGMCFLIGGLRFREQIYNSTVTQMSACLLSLSVMSLLLPTAFHASFADEQTAKANSAVLKVSRGTSVILLFVYVLYLLFQLKSHAYMYESTPQHIIDEELAPGPVAQWMETSSDDSSSSSSSDSEHSSGSNTTAKRFKRVMRGGKRRRKSSSGSKETNEKIQPSRTPSFGAGSVSPVNTEHVADENMGHRLGAIDFGEEGDDEDQNQRSRKNSISRKSKKEIKKERKRQEKKNRKAARRNGDDTVAEGIEMNEKAPGVDAPRRVDFAVEPEPLSEHTDSSSKRPFNIRNMTSIRPQIPKTFSQNVFMQPSPTLCPVPAGPIPRVRYGIRRTNSLPDRLNQTVSGTATPSTRITPNRVNSLAIAVNKPEEEDDENISRTTAMMLLLISTGLVALCAEFMVDSINAVVEGNSGISEAFIGLIILPIVGNAAEHVTAVTVASKNKMDLAIGVAVGSSIQIALFVTPFVVLLGWAMDKNMSLYFTLFETVSLFVSAFIVNFLVLDGRSNYLEGALLCAAYVIIAVAAFFYPNADEQSSLGGADVVAKMVRSLTGM